MKKTVVVIIILSIFFITGCRKKLPKEEYRSFEYEEVVFVGEGAYHRKWKLNCEGVQCSISYVSVATAIEEKLFSKDIILRDKKEAQKILKIILNGVKIRENSYLGYHPENILVFNGRGRLQTDRRNEQFLKLLSKLLEEDHEKVEERIKNDKKQEGRK